MRNLLYVFEIGQCPSLLKRALKFVGGAQMSGLKFFFYKRNKISHIDLK